MHRNFVGRLIVPSLILCAFYSGRVVPAKAIPTHLPQDAPVSQTSQPTDSGLESLRSESARAYRALDSDKAWHFVGTSRIHGANQKFDLIFDSMGRFRISSLGPLSDISAFDGIRCWTCGPSGIPHRVILRDRDLNRQIFWAMSGAWTDPRVHAVVRAPNSSGAGATLTLKTDDGVVDTTLSLDPQTHVAKSLQYRSDTGDEIWTFSDYKLLAGRMLPCHIEHKAGDQSDQIEIKSGSMEADRSVFYRMPRARTAEFDPEIAPTVDIKSVAGLLFLHPLVDGKDVGWFILDSGADVLCIDPAVARQLHLRSVGSDTVAGVVGVSHLNYCQGSRLQVGPAAIKRPVFLELDMTAFSKALQIQIAGICGYDFIAGTSLDIDSKAGKMQVYKPGKVKLPDGAVWHKLDFDENTPLLECRFPGDHQGFFSLDTGSVSTVDFFSPAVEKYHLMDHVDTTSVQVGGAGGTAESKVGKIDWFEMGGQRLEKPLVGFQLTKIGVFASPYRTGNIGMAFMGQFRCILDYANERIAFLAQNGKVSIDHHGK